MAVETGCVTLLSGNVLFLSADPFATDRDVSNPWRDRPLVLSYEILNQIWGTLFLAAPRVCRLLYPFFQGGMLSGADALGEIAIRFDAYL